MLAHAGPQAKAMPRKPFGVRPGYKALLWALHSKSLPWSNGQRSSFCTIKYHGQHFIMDAWPQLGTSWVLAAHLLWTGVMDACFFCSSFSNRFKTKKVCNHWCDVTCTALAFTCPGRAESTVQMSQGSEIVSPPASGAHDPNSFGRRWDLVGADLEHDIGALRHMSHGEGADVSGCFRVIKGGLYVSQNCFFLRDNLQEVRI